MFVLLFVFAAVSLQAQKFVPKSIQFRGDPDYTNKELMVAAGLKHGETLDYAGMNDRSKRLLATGVFATLAFKFDGQDLIFMLTPSTDLVPARFQNIPLKPGTDLDAYLRSQVPLYHGLVPTENGLMESVRVALEKLLAEEGISATVAANTGADVATHKVNVVVYSVTSPKVIVGDLQLSGVSDAQHANIQGALNKLANQPFDMTSSESDLQRAVEDAYHRLGYAAVNVKVAAAGAPVISADAVRIPFSIAVQEGRVYRVASVKLPDGALLSPDDVNKIFADRPGEKSQAARLSIVLGALSLAYKAKGYLDCSFTPHAQFDDAAGTVSYTVDVDPGPVYHLGFVKFDNVTDRLRNLLMRYWQMMPGDVFDENYVADFLRKAMAQDPTLQRSLVGAKESFDATADQQAHTVNVVIRLSR